MTEQEFIQTTFGILDHVPMGVFVLRDDSTVLFWNRCLEQWTKMARDAVVGTNFDDLFDTLSKPIVRLRLQTVFEGGPPTIFSSQLHNYIVPAPLRSGKMRTQHTIVAAVRAPSGNGFYALFTVQDVTDLTSRLEDYLAMRRHAETELKERKKAENELRQQQELLASILESLAARIAVLDRQGIILSCNAAWERFAAERGAPPETMGIGGDYLKAFLSCSDESDKTMEKMHAGLRSVLENRASHFEQEYRCRLSESEHWYIMSAAPLVGGRHGAVVSHIDITTRKQAEQKIEYLALHDNLTDLPNRQLFADRLRQAVSRAKRHRKMLGLLFLDLDDFKGVNDTSGHAFGDYVLIEIANRLRRCVRESDTVARIGGDEFAVIVQDMSGPVDAAIVAQKISQAVAQPMLVQARLVQIGVSVGISVYPKDGDSLETLLRCADAAMYAVKGSGKNRYGFYSEV
jgi:diguanylate cyclase (GGDEF)-like protein/PAS domain S-box-containing protein